MTNIIAKLGAKAGEKAGKWAKNNPEKAKEVANLALFGPLGYAGIKAGEKAAKLVKGVETSTKDTVSIFSKK